HHRGSSDPTACPTATGSTGYVDPPSTTPVPSRPCPHHSGHQGDPSPATTGTPRGKPSPTAPTTSTDAVDLCALDAAPLASPPTTTNPTAHHHRPSAACAPTSTIGRHRCSLFRRLPAHR